MKHGPAFSEHIKTEKIKHWHIPGDKPYHIRAIIPFLLIGLLFLFLIAKLFSLQIVQGSYYRELSDVNRIRTRIVHAPRGVIFDRTGMPLVFNTPGFREITKDGKSIVLTHDQALQKITQGDQSIEVDSLRKYPFGEALSHVTGYTGQITTSELQTSDSSYKPTDIIGKSGIEQYYEKELRGTDGKQLYEVDALGKPVRLLGQTDPIPGQDITVTIDATLQQAVYQAAQSIKKGAVIVSKPNGEVLSLVSQPSYDVNLFTLDASYHPSSTSAYPSIASVLLDGTNQPLLNRAISGTYPPGSTFKIVTAAAGLVNHVIDKNYHITDTGIIKIGDFSFANWYYTQYGKTDGEVNVVKALARSNDIFFYKLAQLIKVDPLTAVAKKFGVGSVLGIDLGGEAKGLAPTTEWKKAVMHEDWFLGDTYHYGIGQGYLLTTPLQVNAWTQAIANAGTLYQPHLQKDLGVNILQKGLLSDTNFALIRQGMIEACSTGGVAWPLFNFTVKNAALKIDGKNVLSVASSSADMRKITVACKTGTAQHGDEETLPHAWITLFAPAYNPEVVVTVLNESSGEGSNEAAPVAKKVLEAYFTQKK